MLTPAIDDPNRKEELRRKEKEPTAFGVPRLDMKEIKDRPLNGHMLVTDQGLNAPEEPQEPQEPQEPDTVESLAVMRKQWEEYLDQPVGDITPELEGIEDMATLEFMAVVESEGKNRKTLIEAIAAEIAKRNGQGE